MPQDTLFHQERHSSSSRNIKNQTLHRATLSCIQPCPPELAIQVPNLCSICADPGDDLPLCDISKGAVAPGRWVMKPPIKPILPTSTSLGALLDKPKVFCPVCENRKPAYRACGSGKQWITDPRRYAWIPYDCKYPTVTKRQAGSCLGKLRILFSGDSHTRTFYNAFMEQVCDIPSAAQKGHATSQCHEPNATSACSGARMCMEHNYLG